MNNATMYSVLVTNFTCCIISLIVVATNDDVMIFSKNKIVNYKANGSYKSLVFLFHQVLLVYDIWYFYTFVQVLQQDKPRAKVMYGLWYMAFVNFLSGTSCPASLTCTDVLKLLTEQTNKHRYIWHWWDKYGLCNENRRNPTPMNPFFDDNLYMRSVASEAVIRDGQYHRVSAVCKCPWPW